MDPPNLRERDNRCEVGRMAGFGASTSLLVAAATVGSLNRQQPLAGSPGRYHTDRRQGLRPGEPPEGKLDRSKGDKGGEGFGEVLEILG